MKPNIDRVALDAATKIMKVVSSPVPKGGPMQVKAQVQEEVRDALDIMLNGTLHLQAHPTAGATVYTVEPGAATPTSASREPTQEQLDAFILDAGFTYGWRNMESWARRMVEHAVADRAQLVERVAVLEAAPYEVWIVSNKTFSAICATEEIAQSFVSSQPASVGGGMRVYQSPVIGSRPTTAHPHADEAAKVEVEPLRAALVAVDQQLVTILNGADGSVYKKLKAARNDLVRIWLPLSVTPSSPAEGKPV